MTTPSPGRRAHLVLAVTAAGAAAAYFVSMWLGTAGHPALPLDDAFIFFQYARQLVRGHPFRYTDGAPASGGVTSVLMMLIDAAGWGAGFRGDGMIYFSFLVGAAGLWLTLVSARRLGVAIGLSRPFWAPLFTVLCGPLLWGMFAGMDLPLFTGAMLATFAAWAEEAGGGPGRRRTISWGCLTAAARPEGLLFAGVLSTLLVMEGYQGPVNSGAAGTGGDGHPVPPPRPVLPALRRCLPVVAALVPALILLAGTGRLRPTSFQVKGVVGLPGVDLGTWLAAALGYFASTFRSIFLGFASEAPGAVAANAGGGILLYLAPLTALLFFAGSLPGAAAEGSRRRPGVHLLALLTLLIGLASASLVVPKAWHWHRYLIPYYAVMLPFAALGLERLLAGLATQAPGTPPAGLRAAGIFAYTVLAAPGALYFLIAFAQNSADIAFQQKALAQWAARTLPAGAVIGTNDAGALAYYGDHPLLDLEGLVTPALTAPRRSGVSSLWEALERLPEAERPPYLIVYANWYDPAFLKPHQLIYARRLFRQTIAGGNPMNVYQADWSLANSGDRMTAADPAGLLAGMSEKDRLDVADLADEAAHGYAFRSVEGQYQGLLEMLPGGAGGPQVIDGGRVITRDESFWVRGLVPGRDMVVVLRSRGPFRVRVAVNGNDAGEWTARNPAGPGWTEETYRIPGRLIGAAEVRLTVSVGELHENAYTSFHYWFWQ